MLKGATGKYRIWFAVFANNRKENFRDYEVDSVETAAKVIKIFIMEFERLDRKSNYIFGFEYFDEELSQWKEWQSADGEDILAYIYYHDPINR